MRKKNQLNKIYVFVDIVVITISVYMPYVLRYNSLSFSQFWSLPFMWKELTLPAFSAYSLIFLFWGMITILIINNYRLYKKSDLVKLLNRIEKK